MDIQTPTQSIEQPQTPEQSQDQPIPRRHRKNDRHWLRQLFSEDNGNDLCVAKILATVGFVSYLAYAAVGLHQGHFVLADFGTGLMTVLLGSAGIISGKNFSTRQ